MNDRYWKYATAHAFLGAGNFHEMTQQMRTLMKHSDKKLGSKLIHNFARYVFIDGLRRGNPNISEEALQKEWYDFAASFDDKPKFILDIKHSGEPLGKIDLRTDLGFTQADIERVVAQAETNLAEPEYIEFDPKAHVCKGEDCSCSFGRQQMLDQAAVWGYECSGAISQKCNGPVSDWVIFEYFPKAASTNFRNPFAGDHERAFNYFRELSYNETITTRQYMLVMARDCGKNGWQIAKFECAPPTSKDITTIVQRLEAWVQTEALVPTPKTESDERMYAIMQYSVPNGTAKFTAAFPATPEQIDRMFKNECRSRILSSGEILIALTLGESGKWAVYCRDESSSQRLTDWSYDTPAFHALVFDWASFGCTVNSFGPYVPKTPDDRTVVRK